MLTDEDWEHIGFYRRVRLHAREVPIGRKQKAVIVDQPSLLARLRIENVPEDSWKSYAASVDFLMDLDQGDVALHLIPKPKSQEDDSAD